MSLKRLSEEFQRFEERKAGSEQEFFSFLKKGIPLEYINQSSYFYKSEFFVDERVLIPRSETEILVERAVSQMKKYKDSEISLCEIGVGSGAISLSCLMDISEKKVKLTATDISEEAMEVFKTNLFLHEFSFSSRHEVKTIVTDRLNGVEGDFDFILSNPPYIKEVADKDLVHSQVLKFEPHVALFLKDTDYFSWFEDFFQMVSDRLKKGGVFIMEGHESHLTDLKALMDKQGWGETAILKDLTGTFRFLEGIKK